jgi:hypothetical protein
MVGEETANKPEEKNLIEEAKIEREKIEKATEAMKAENERAERLAIQKELSGKSKGTSIPEKSNMDEYKEKAEERYRGTGMSPAKGYARQWD